MSTDDYKRGLERAAEIARTWRGGGPFTAEVAQAIAREAASTPAAAVQPSDEALVRKVADAALDAVVTNGDYCECAGLQTSTVLEVAATAARAALAVVRRADARRGGEALTFDDFTRANRERCGASKAVGGFGRPVDEVNAQALIQALVLGVAEEAGEVAGATRTLLGISAHKVATVEDVADEIADLVSYCDLLAAALGTDLATALVRKWNRVSEKRGYPVRIGAAPPAEAKGGEVCGREVGIPRATATGGAVEVGRCELPPNHEPAPCGPRGTR